MIQRNLPGPLLDIREPVRDGLRREIVEHPEIPVAVVIHALFLPEGLRDKNPALSSHLDGHRVGDHIFARPFLEDEALGEFLCLRPGNETCYRKQERASLS